MQHTRPGRFPGIPWAGHDQLADLLRHAPTQETLVELVEEGDANGQFWEGIVYTIGVTGVMDVIGVMALLVHEDPHDV